jgi:hypothetical protein
MTFGIGYRICHLVAIPMSTTLVFWVFGADCDSTICVDIALNKNVGDLNEAIKEKKKPALDHLPADALDLWKVSVPFDNEYEEKVKALDLNTERPLSARRKLDSLFSHKSASADDCLDIVVKVPLLSLNCFILRVDEKPSQIFTVKILKTENVSTLKDLIKEKQSPRFNHVVASELILSQVSLPVDDDLKESLKNVDLTPLNPLLPLSQMFPRVEENRLHIVVQAPTDGEPISVLLHVIDNLIDVVQRAWVLKTNEKRRGETGSLPCVKVRVFFLLLPSLINNI